MNQETPPLMALHFFIFIFTSVDFPKVISVDLSLTLSS